jgi:hypothetical protein
MKKIILLAFVAVVLVSANFSKFKSKEINTQMWTVKDAFEGKR